MFVTARRDQDCCELNHWVSGLEVKRVATLPKCPNGTTFGQLKVVAAPFTSTDAVKSTFQAMAL